MDILQKTDLCLAGISGIAGQEARSAELQANQLGRLKLWMKDFSTIATDADRRLASFLHRSSHLTDALHAQLDLILMFLDTLEPAELEPDDVLKPTTQDESDARGMNGPGDDLLERTLMAVATAIDSLNRLLPTLYSPSPHDMLLDARYSSIWINTRRDVDRVKTEFPKAADFLTERLGVLNSVRRAAREYAQARFESAVTGTEGTNPTMIEQPKNEANETDPPTLQPPERRAFSLISGQVSSTGPQTLGSTDPSTLQSSTFDTPAPGYVADNNSESSAGSLTSYAATVNPSGDRTVRLPAPPPGFLSGQPFTCTVCYRPVEGIRSSRRWKRHIFTDLRPYVCTFADCKSQMAMFTRRRDWFEHEMEVHRSRYVCAPCNRIFGTAYDLQQHLVATHYIEITTEQAARLVDVMRFTVTPASAPCPCCARVFTSMREYQRHVGGELERVALFILPSGPSDIEADESSSDGDDDDDQDSDDAQESSTPSALSVKGKEKEMDVMEKLALSQALEADQNGGKKIQSNVTGPRDLPEGWRPGDRYCLLHEKPEIPWTLDKFDVAEPFSCTSLCGATFKDKAQWKEHEEWNFPKSLWICSWCADVFPRRSLLMQHQKIIHGRQNIDILTDCLDLGAFQRDCFFECGFSSNRFQNWIDHVAGHVAEFLAYDGLAQKAAELSDGLNIGPLSALKLLHPEPGIRIKRSTYESMLSQLEKVEKQVHEWQKLKAETPNVLNETSTGPSEPIGVSELTAPPMIRESPTLPKPAETTVAKILRQFTEFSDLEKQRVAARRRAQTIQGREEKLAELRNFAKTFKLKTPVPSDLIEIFAKDPRSKKR